MRYARLAAYLLPLGFFVQSVVAEDSHDDQCMPVVGQVIVFLCWIFCFYISFRFNEFAGRFDQVELLHGGPPRYRIDHRSIFTSGNGGFCMVSLNICMFTTFRLTRKHVFCDGLSAMMAHLA